MECPKMDLSLSLSLKLWANVNHRSYYVYSIQHRMTATEGLIASTSALSSVGETAKPIFYLHNNKPCGSVYEVWKLRSHHENRLVLKEPPHNDPKSRQLQYWNLCPADFWAGDGGRMRLPIRADLSFAQAVRHAMFRS